MDRISPDTHPIDRRDFLKSASDKEVLAALTTVPVI
jgi:hypothetical protein